MLREQLSSHLAHLKEQGLYRQRHLDSADDIINFSSNDYLSLTTDARIKHAYQHGFSHYPTGSGGSMLTCGYHPIHQQLEQAFATALGVDDCVLFSSGYAANISVTGLLARLAATMLVDKHIHASIYDGLALAGAHYGRYLHNDLPDLTAKIKISAANTVVLTEGIFSMSGQLAPLAQIAQLCRQNHSELLVDEAHAFGVLGYQGLGAVVLHQLTQEDVPLRIIPFGKTLGASGAVVAGDAQWIAALLQSGRTAIYSTAISQAFTYGLLETLEIIRSADQRRIKLHELIRYFRQAVARSPLTWCDSHTPIQQLRLGCPHRAVAYAAKLREQGILCRAIRSPTVPKQHAGLRVILNYDHQPEDIDYLFECLLRVD